MSEDTGTLFPLKLAKWIDDRQAQGLYFFTREEVFQTLQLSDAAFKMAVSRLQKKERILRVLSGFYIIIPVEYSSTRVLPADWFINDLMAYVKQPYYVGLLSAAVLFGAGHQQPQEFQVVTSHPLRAIHMKNLSIRFFVKTKFAATLLKTLKVQTGYIHISSPEATAIDLLRYASSIGGVDRVFTVLQELAESIKPAGLLEAVQADGTVAYAQRLGWLLEKAGYDQKKLKTLHEWIKRKKPLTTRLDPSLPGRGTTKENRWNILVNTELEGEF
ncbi:MAG: type IV toxin-antitoxin system AbiEi family antitoxin [Pseudomonadota bacterium]